MNPETAGAIDTLVALASGNPDKALVLSYICQLVVDDIAVWEIFENGEIEVHLKSGETFLLGERTVLRLA